MLILAFDTALAACSAAIWDSRENTVLACEHQVLERGHAEALAPMVRRVLTESGRSIEDLDCLGVTTGPGTFAGVRIGIAMARGMSLAVGIPAIGVTTLQTVAGALKVSAGTKIASIFDARRGEFYAQCFDATHEPLTQPMLCRPDELPSFIGSIVGPGPVKIIGSGAKTAEPLLRAVGIGAEIAEASALPDAVVIARFAARNPGHDDLEPPAPLYLRAPDAKLPEAVAMALSGARRP